MTDRKPAGSANGAGDPLATPITGHWNHLGETEDKYRERVQRERCAKLILLAEKYGISDLSTESVLAQLAMILAIDHIPGFKILETPPKPSAQRGRPHRSDDLHIYTLIEMLRDECESRGEKFELKATCQNLHRERSTRRGGSMLSHKTPASIERAYYTARTKYGSLDPAWMKRILAAIPQIAPDMHQRKPRMK